MAASGRSAPERATHSAGVAYVYDADGNRTSMTDGTGTSTYTYDPLDRLTQSEAGDGASVGYEYDAAGEPVKLTYPSGKSVERSYDGLGRLASVTDWLHNTTHFS
jgi:YD repeat-containing protein